MVFETDFQKIYKANSSIAVTFMLFNYSEHQFFQIYKNKLKNIYFPFQASVTNIEFPIIKKDRSTLLVQLFLFILFFISFRYSSVPVRTGSGIKGHI